MLGRLVKGLSASLGSEMAAEKRRNLGGNVASLGRDLGEIVAVLRGARRINVVGTSGSGKTTFSRQLAAILGLPCHEMDELFWLPGWQQPREEDFREKVVAAVSGPEWVLDGNYGRTASIKWAEVECVVWLDYSFARVISQALGRAIGRSLKGEEIWPGTGNRESLRQTFLSKKSILLWTLKTFRSNRERYRAAMEEGDARAFAFVRIGSRAEAAAILRELRQLLP